MLGSRGWLLGGGSSTGSGPEKIAGQELDKQREEKVLLVLGLGEGCETTEPSGGGSSLTPTILMSKQCLLTKRWILSLVHIVLFFQAQMLYTFSGCSGTIQ